MPCWTNATARRPHNGRDCHFKRNACILQSNSIQLNSTVCTLQMCFDICKKRKKDWFFAMFTHIYTHLQASVCTFGWSLTQNVCCFIRFAQCALAELNKWWIFILIMVHELSVATIQYRQDEPNQRVFELNVLLMDGTLVNFYISK